MKVQWYLLISFIISVQSSTTYEKSLANLEEKPQLSDESKYIIDKYNHFLVLKVKESVLNGAIKIANDISAMADDHNTNFNKMELLNSINITLENVLKEAQQSIKMNAGISLTKGQDYISELSNMLRYRLNDYITQVKTTRQLSSQPPQNILDLIQSGFQVISNGVSSILNISGPTPSPINNNIWQLIPNFIASINPFKPTKAPSSVADVPVDATVSQPPRPILDTIQFFIPFKVTTIKPTISSDIASTTPIIVEDLVSEDTNKKS